MDAMIPKRRDDHCPPVPRVSPRVGRPAETCTNNAAGERLSPQETLKGLHMPSARRHGKDPGVGLLSPEDWTAVGERFELTARELSVAILIFEGKTRDQIARRMTCAPGTVRVYIDRLFLKLDVHDRLGMALRVMRVYLGLNEDHDKD